MSKLRISERNTKEKLVFLFISERKQKAHAKHKQLKAENEALRKKIEELSRRS